MEVKDLSASPKYSSNLNRQRNQASTVGSIMAWNGENMIILIPFIDNHVKQQNTRSLNQPSMSIPNIKTALSYSNSDSFNERSERAVSDYYQNKLDSMLVHLIYFYFVDRIAFSHGQSRSPNKFTPSKAKSNIVQSFVSNNMFEPIVHNSMNKFTKKSPTKTYEQMPNVTFPSHQLQVDKHEEILKLESTLVKLNIGKLH